MWCCTVNRQQLSFHACRPTVCFLNNGTWTMSVIIGTTIHQAPFPIRVKWHKIRLLWFQQGCMPVWITYLTRQYSGLNFNRTQYIPGGPGGPCRPGMSLSPGNPGAPTSPFCPGTPSRPSFPWGPWTVYIWQPSLVEFWFEDFTLLSSLGRVPAGWSKGIHAQPFQFIHSYLRISVFCTRAIWRNFTQ